MSSSSLRAQCTILMPVHNGALYLEKSIRNLIEISLPADEILVINDGSTDSTAQLLEELEKESPRITVIHLEKSGLVAALNIGIQKARHEFIVRADVDDSYLHNRIDLQLEIISSSDEIAAVFSDYNFFSRNEENLGCLPTAITGPATKLSLVDAFRTPHPSVVFRKSIVLQVGGYRSEDFPAEDLGLWIRLSQKFELRTCPQPLLNYRLNPAGVTSSRQKLMKLKRDALLANLDYAELLRENLNSYKDLRNGYRKTGHNYKRLALHNFDLLLCIKRVNVPLATRLGLFLRVGIRFMDLRITLALVCLIAERKKRKSNQE